MTPVVCFSFTWELAYMTFVTDSVFFLSVVYIILRGSWHTVTVSRTLNRIPTLPLIELQESPDLLSVWLEVLRYYQTLSPTIFLVAGYNLTKLLPTVGGKGIPSAVVMPTIQLLTEAPVGSIKWTQKVCLWEEFRTCYCDIVRTCITVISIVIIMTYMYVLLSCVHWKEKRGTCALRCSRKIACLVMYTVSVFNLRIVFYWIVAIRPKQNMPWGIKHSGCLWGFCFSNKKKNAFKIEGYIGMHLHKIVVYVLCHYCWLPPQGGSALKSVLLLMLNPSMEIATMATTLAHKVRT